MRKKLTASIFLIAALAVIISSVVGIWAFRRRELSAARQTLTELLARCPHFEVDLAGVEWAGGSYVRRPLSVPFRVTG